MTTEPKPTERDRTGYHEAGHVVMRILRTGPWALGIRASVVPDATSLGRVLSGEIGIRPSPRLVGEQRRIFIDEIKVALAGPLAEAHRITEVVVGPRATARDDLDLFDHANELLGAGGDTTTARTIARAVSFSEGAADQLVQTHAELIAGRFHQKPRLWHIVGTVACALLRFQDLGDSDLFWWVRHAARGRNFGELVNVFSGRRRSWNDLGVSIRAADLVW